MKPIMVLAAAAVVAASSTPGVAQFRPLTQDNAANAFGDTNLSYFGGVVYDDDLVPGFPPNQPFLIEEQVTGSTSSIRRDPILSRRPVTIRPNSRQLIGSDGKIKR